MIYPSTAIFHGILGFLGLISFIYLYYFKNDDNDAVVRYYYSWFFFFFLYNTILLLPLFLFDDLNFMTGIFYDTALLFLGIATWYGFRLALQLKVESETKKKLATILYIAGVVMAVMLHFIFSEVPLGSFDDKWVFWHTRDISNYFYSILMFVAGWTFAYVNFEAFLKLPTLLLKTRVLLYAISGFILPFSAIYYFGADSVKEIYLAYALSVAGMAFFAIGNIALGALIKSGIQKV